MSLIGLIQMHKKTKQERDQLRNKKHYDLLDKAIKELENAIENQDDKGNKIGRICHNPRCKYEPKYTLQPRKIFYNGNKECNNCQTCRNKNKSIEKRRYDNDILTGRAKEKEDNRQEKLRIEIATLREKYNDDPLIWVCSHRDCKNRVQPITEFAYKGEGLREQCATCRGDNSKYLQELRARYKIINPEWQQARSLQHKNWVKNNPEKIVEYLRRRRINSKEKIKNIFIKAIERKIYFEIDLNYGAELCEQSCYYCGIEVNDQTINGIDRIINSVGYIRENCVPCCTECNYIKGSAKVSTFYKRIKHLYKSLKIGPCPQDWVYPKAFYDQNRLHLQECEFLYNKLLDSAKYRGIKVEKDFNENYCKTLIEQPCTYCKLKDFPRRNKVGIDRIDSNGPYSIENCIPCCTCCNYLKNNYELTTFYQKIKLIVEKHFM